MKKSDLKKEIKDYIYEILSEADLDKTSGSAILPKTTPPVEIKKLTDKNIDVQLKEEDEEEKEDNWNKPDKDDKGSDDDDTLDKQAKANAKKEKIKTVSKFKISQEKYEQLKSTLKTVVDKVKDLNEKIKKEKSPEKLKELKKQKQVKIEALKKFMKNQELVKAFKERDVKIDTGGLVGESISENKIKGKKVDPEFDIYTYDHLLPKGTGDDFTRKQFDMMMQAVENDKQILKKQNKKIKTGKDDTGLPYLELV